MFSQARQYVKSAKKGIIAAGSVGGDATNLPDNILHYHLDSGLKSSRLGHAKGWDRVQAAERELQLAVQAESETAKKLLDDTAKAKALENRLVMEDHKGAWAQTPGGGA
ncbi:hypothetical protein ColTof4_14417 [Colletotrichum tofieldiae]|nr:hypothetical protein ColTof3_14863 [Colletotrichum tofieldiae]GKT81994.1 hypothetical protein ColTof4_14417 [Colletotrichum tofieldiae]